MTAEGSAAGRIRLAHPALLVGPVAPLAPGRGGRGAGRLGVRVFGHRNSVLVLLTGIGATQAFFGAAYDRIGEVGTVVVIDPLGFVFSMDGAVSTGAFALAHSRADLPPRPARFFAIAPFATDWNPVLRAFVLTLIVVPVAVYLVVPQLMRGYGMAHARRMR